MSTAPTFRTWVTGEVVTAAEMNANIRDAGQYLTGGSAAQRPTFVARQNAVTSMTNGVYTTMLHGQVDRDTDSSYAPGSGQFFVNTAGLFLFVATFAFANNATGSRGGRLLCNNGMQSVSAILAAAEDSLGHCTCAFLGIMGAGTHTMVAQGLQTSGGALNSSGNNDSTFSAAWLAS